MAPAARRAVTLGDRGAEWTAGAPGRSPAEPDISRLHWPTVLVATAVVGALVLGIIGTASNWFSALTGQMYSQPELDAARDAAYESGARSGAAEGRRDGYEEGYEAGEVDGRDEGYDAGVRAGEAEAHQRNRSDEDAEREDAERAAASALPAVLLLPSGLLCRDVAARGYGFAAAVDYWFVEGRPDRMDQDLNGVPCETVYLPAEVQSYVSRPGNRLRADG